MCRKWRDSVRDPFLTAKRPPSRAIAKKLRDAPVMETDLRASVVVGDRRPRAEGETMVNASIIYTAGSSGSREKAVGCGAAIERISD